MIVIENKPDKTDLLRLFTIVHRYKVAGMDTLESIRAYHRSCTKESMKEITGKIIKLMSQGLFFSEAIEKCPEFIPSFVVKLIRVGEDSGEMEAILEEIILFLKQDVDMDRDIKSAMFTQKILLIGIVFVFSIALIFVIPQISEIISNLDVEIPLVTKIVIAMGNFVSGFWWLIGLGCFGVYLFFKKMKKDNPVRYTWLKFHIPVFNTIWKLQLQYKFTKIFGICRKAGMVEIDSLRYTAEASDNALFNEVLQKTITDMARSGTDFVSLLKKNDIYDIIDPSLYTMLQTGGATANIDKIMISESDGYRKDLEAALKTMGEKIGLFVTIPGYVCIIILFAAIEFPVMNIMEGLGKMGIGG